MNIIEKEQEIVDNLTNFLKGTLSGSDLAEFAWEIIDYYSTTPDENLPAWGGEDESLLWGAIWQIQHLASESEIKDGIAQKNFEQTLQYLTKQKKVPSDYFGRRP